MEVNYPMASEVLDEVCLVGWMIPDCLAVVKLIVL